MTLSAIQQLIYNLTNSDATSYPNANMLVDLNVWYERTVMAILRSRDDWEFDDSNKTDFPILTSDLVANQQDYALPAGCLKIQRVELAFDGVTPYKAEPIDIGMISKGTSPTQINQWANQNRPYYDVRYGSFFVYPIPSASTSNNTGIKIWVARSITEFTSGDLSTGTAVPGFDAPFHQLLAYGAAYNRAISKNLVNAKLIKDTLDSILAELSTYYGNKDEDMTWSIEPAYKDYGQLNYQTGNIRRLR